MDEYEAEDFIRDDGTFDGHKFLTAWMESLHGTFPTERCDFCEEDKPIPERFVDVRGRAICQDCQQEIWEARPRGYKPPKPGKAKIPTLLRRAVFERDAYRCRYCGGHEGGLACDHVIPESKGGDTTTENLVTACNPCNVKKSARTPEDAGMPLLPEP